GWNVMELRCDAAGRGTFRRWPSADSPCSPPPRPRASGLPGRGTTRSATSGGAASTSGIRTSRPSVSASTTAWPSSPPLHRSSQRKTSQGEPAPSERVRLAPPARDVEDLDPLDALRQRRIDQELAAHGLQ